MHLLQEHPNGDFLKSPAHTATVKIPRQAGPMKESSITWVDAYGSFQDSYKTWGTGFGVLDCSEEEEIPFQKGSHVYGPNIGLPHMGRKMDFKALDTVELNLGFHLPGV